MKNTPRNQHPAPLLLAALLALTLASAAPAAVVKQTRTAAANESWSTAALWDNDAGASAGNDYFTNGYILRTPTVGGGTGSTTFPTGASLTVAGGDGGATSALWLKSKTTNIGNLSLGAGGAVANLVNTGTNQPATLNVTDLTILGDATKDEAAILRGSAVGNDLTVNVTRLLGDGYLQFTNPRAYSLSVTDAAAFTGELNLDQGTLTLDSDFAATSATFSMSTTGASLVLASNLSVSSFTFGATTLDVVGGTYTSAQLNALFSTAAFSGTGLLQVGVIPEPSSLGLILGGLALAACGARRRRLAITRT